GQARGFELLGAQPMPRHVDHVVDAPENPEVTVGGEHGAVCREVRPVVPVLALRVFAVLGVVLLHEALAVSPDRLDDPRPRVADADVPGASGSGADLLALLVIDDRVDAGQSRPGAAGFHPVERGFGAAKESAVFRLPPRVDDDGFALADDVVVPAPDLGLD